MVDDADPHAADPSLQYQAALKLAELVHLQHRPLRRYVIGLVSVGREGPVAFHVLTGKDAAAGQGRRDGKGHHRLADAGRTGKNHGVRQAVLFHQADQPLLDGAVADNILKIQLVHGLPPVAGKIILTNLL